MAQTRILITGGSGFLGRALVKSLLAEGASPAVLSRSPDKTAALFGPGVAVHDSLQSLEPASFQVVVNLAGAGIFDAYWTPARKQILRDSRIGLSQGLIHWMAASGQAPPVLLSGSAVGVYGNRGDAPLTEYDPIPDQADFAQTLCLDWERTALQAQRFGTRVCLLRSGLVLGRDGGLLKKLLLPYRLGLGGKLGSGRQWMSWIHLDDWLAAVRTLLDDPQCQGAYNLSAPQPISNAEFDAELARQLRRPRLLPLPAWLLKILLAEMSQLLLGSQRAVPERLLRQGFRFRYPSLATALESLLTG